MTSNAPPATFATPEKDKEQEQPAPPIKAEEPSGNDAKPNTVTPLESSATRDSSPPVVTVTSSSKHVRFNKDDKEEEEKSKRGLVSRRGGRIGSPASLKEHTPVLEFKTYRSPQRKRDGDVPSLCSASSTAKQEATKNAPSSISCDPSMIDSTSPLTSSPPKTTEEQQEQGGRRNVTFSPPPPPPTEEISVDPPKKTPTKSPTDGQFQTLPSLQDPKANSPSCGIYLSQSPTSSNVSAVPALEKKETKKEEAPPKPPQPKPAPAPPEEKQSAKARDQERERAVATPTDFAFDFGKGLRQTASFDASNVLAWLQSPTANGLFSPGGGLGSALNTPRGAGGNVAGPRTPHTPTMSTSFFFSDVASLPKGNDLTSPKPEGAAGTAAAANKRGGPQGVYSSMICISPLASSKRKSASQPQTPMNYNDVFASPRDPRDSGKPSGLPFLGESPAAPKKRGKDGNLDAHMAERDLMEDEDLSVLLQLASNTPGRARDGSGTHVFRSSPRGQKPAGYPNSQGNYEGNPGLQLPVIGGRGDTSSKLARKPNTARDQGGADDFKPPQLAIRSSSSGGSKEIYSRDDASKPAGKSESSKSKAFEKSKSSGTQSSKSGGATRKGGGSRKDAPTSYSIPGSHPPYPHPGAEQPVSYYPLPGTMPAMPPGGSMRVVVGGPPPTRKPTGNSPARRPGSPSSRGQPYPIHPGPGDGYGRHPMPYPPHHGMYSQHPPPHMSGMGVPPPYAGMYPPQHHHHPPPGPMPLYSSQQPSHGSTTKPPSLPAKKPPKAKSSRSAAKRSASSTSQSKTPGSATKKRKSPSKGSARKKRKDPTPASNDPVDRQKTAAAIAAVNAASGGHNDKAAALAAAILRGVTMRPSGKWQAQLYYAGKSRYIGVFDTREKAALAYEIAREKLKSAQKVPNDNSAQSIKATEAAVNSARKAAFEGVNEKDPRLSSK